MCIKMNWENYFNELKIGDKVELIQISKLCLYAGDSCCRVLIGKMGKIINIWKNDQCPYNVQFPNGNGQSSCNFEKECLRKIQ